EQELARGRPAPAAGQVAVLPELIGRMYRVRGGAGRTVKEIEVPHQHFLTIEKIRRAGKPVEPRPDVMLRADDVVLLVGRREGIIDAAATIGDELPGGDGFGAVMQTRQAVFTRKGMNHTTIAAVRANVDRDLRHGVFIQGVTRAGQPLPILPETELMHGDVVTFYGSPQDTRR
ncbi:TrkA C-terminal domain-containing protein, partial [Paraburkholderia bryophila]|uniref:TrkA C-terminal domain-containing protein n=1 Tax=Paraburkholderia bryophila TaxID=420952 RepID=UPI001FC8AFD7